MTIDVSPDAPVRQTSFTVDFLFSEFTYSVLWSNLRLRSDYNLHHLFQKYFYELYESNFSGVALKSGEVSRLIDIESLEEFSTGFKTKSVPYGDRRLVDTNLSPRSVNT